MATAISNVEPKEVFATTDKTTTTSKTTSSAKNSTDEEALAAQKLNASYEALEKMRKLNLEVNCSKLGIPFDPTQHTVQCTACLLGQQQQQHKSFPRLRQFMGDDNNFPRIRKLVEQHHTKKSPPCLICGSPACRTHSSATFYQNNCMTICHECEQLFDLNFVVDCLLLQQPDDNSSRQRRRRQQLTDRMLDAYDRSLLLLRYASAYLEPVARSLEATTERQNAVGLGSSGVGIASGVLGIAAAATILTPAGPPLLIASLLFGGSATAVQTGTEAMNYYSRPNQLADRIIALNGVRLSILKITSILRDAMLLDHVRSEAYDTDNKTGRSILTPEQKQHQQPLLDGKTRGSVLGGLTVGRYGMASVEISRAASAAEAGVVAGRNARFFSRTGSNLMRTARFARFAGGALSAAILVLEAKSMSNTIQAMMDGNPCEKANTLRAIREELKVAVDTNALDRECETYLKAMDDRKRAMTEEEVTRLLVEQSEAAAQDARQLQMQLMAATEGSRQDPVGSIILDGVEDESVSNTVDDQSHSASNQMSLSLLERIELHKQLEASNSETLSTFHQNTNGSHQAAPVEDTKDTSSG